MRQFVEKNVMSQQHEQYFTINGTTTIETWLISQDRQSPGCTDFRGLMNCWTHVGLNAKFGPVLLQYPYRRPAFYLISSSPRGLLADAAPRYRQTTASVMNTRFSESDFGLLQQLLLLLLR